MLEIACTYFGFGLPEYRECAKYFVKSAKRHHNAQLTQITDRYTPPLEGFGRVVRLEDDAPWNGLMSAKGQGISQYAKKTPHEKTVFADPDVYFNKNIEPAFGDWDLGLCVRRTSPHKFYHGGLVFSTYKARPFWDFYQLTIEKMPLVLAEWWAEQMAYAVILGIDRKVGDVFTFRGVKIALLDFFQYTSKPDKPEDTFCSYTTHFTGTRKKFVGEYDLRQIQRTEP